MASDGRRRYVTGTVGSSSSCQSEDLSLDALRLDTSPQREERRLVQPSLPLYPDYVVTHISVEDSKSSSSRRKKKKKKKTADSDGQSSVSGRNGLVGGRKCSPDGEERERLVERSGGSPVYADVTHVRVWKPKLSGRYEGDSDTTEWKPKPQSADLQETEAGDAGADGMRKQKRDEASNRSGKRQQSRNVETLQLKAVRGVESSSGWDDDVHSAPSASPSSSAVPDFQSVDAVDQFDAGYFDEQMNILGTDVTVRVAYSAKGVADWIDECPTNEGIFGFDIEWKPNFVKGQNNDAALCQLACAERCLIVQLLHIDYIPEKLKAFLADPRKRLVGVGVKGDVNKLSEAYDLTCRGEVDLGACAADVFKDPKLKQAGLTTLSSVILGIPFKKSKRITTSNWAVQGLSYNQIVYAATDAWIAYSMLIALEAKQREQTSASIAEAVPHLLNQGEVHVGRQGR